MVRSLDSHAFSAGQDLARRLTGAVVAPGDPDWDAAREAWNLAVDQRPALVALPESAADVAEVIGFAGSAGLRVAVQGTGHGAAARADLGGAILLNMERMTGVEIDPVARRARAAAGTLWQEVTQAPGARGLAALAGSSPDVGVVGYTLGGGVGWLGRRYGLACNAVTAVEVVTADGQARRVDARSDAELFWALRGGGGAFAAVTALEFALYPVAEVHAGTLFWPFDRAREVLHAWREWTAGLPATATTIGRLLQFPPLQDLPEPLRGRRFAAVEAVFLYGEAEGRAALRPLRDLQPAMDTFADIPAAALQTLHMDPEQPVPGLGDHRLLASLPPAAVDALVDVTGPDSGSPLLSVELRHLGGALAASAPAHGALDRIAAEFALYGVGIALPPEQGQAVAARLDALRAGLAPWDAGRDYLNFAERPADPARLFGQEAGRRLAAVKRTYDPGDVFLSNHPVAPAG